MRKKKKHHPSNQRPTHPPTWYSSPTRASPRSLLARKTTISATRPTRSLSSASNPAHFSSSALAVRKALWRCGSEEDCDRYWLRAGQGTPVRTRERKASRADAWQP
jgi:hypothetical protein